MKREAYIQSYQAYVYMTRNVMTEGCVCNKHAAAIMITTSETATTLGNQQCLILAALPNQRLLMCSL
jgi:hypothetical protein